MTGTLRFILADVERSMVDIRWNLLESLQSNRRLEPQRRKVFHKTEAEGSGTPRTCQYTTLNDSARYSRAVMRSPCNLPTIK